MWSAHSGVLERRMFHYLRARTSCCIVSAPMARKPLVLETVFKRLQSSCSPAECALLILKVVPSIATLSKGA